MLKNYGKQIKFIRSAVIILFLILTASVLTFGFFGPAQVNINVGPDGFKNVVYTIAVTTMFISFLLIIVGVIAGLVLNYLPVVKKKELQTFLAENYSHPFTKKELKKLGSFAASTARKSGRVYVSKPALVTKLRGKLPHTINPMFLMQETLEQTPFLVTIDFKGELQLVPTINDELDYNFVKSLFNYGHISLLGLNESVVPQNDNNEDDWAKQILIDYSNPMETNQKNTKIWIHSEEFKKYYETVDNQFNHIMINKIYSLLDVLVALDEAEHLITVVNNGEEFPHVPSDLIQVIMKMKMF